MMRIRRPAPLALVAAGAAILALAWWLRNPIIPYGGDTPSASDISAAGARDGRSAEAAQEAVDALAASVASTHRDLVRVAAAALRAPASAEAAFAHLERLPDSPEIGVVLFAGALPQAWAGQLQSLPDPSRPGTTVLVSPFYTSLQVAADDGARRGGAPAPPHPEPPANDVTRSLEQSIGQMRFVLSIRVGAVSDSSAGRLVTGAGGQPLMRVGAIPLPEEVLQFRTAASTRARGAILLSIAVVVLLGAAWSERRLVRSRVLAVAVALGAVALTPWNNFSNFSRVFDPAYYYSTLLGPFTASAGAFAMFAALVLLGVTGVIRASRGKLNRLAASVAGVVLLFAGLAVAVAAAGGIVLPVWGSNARLWLGWQVPLFLVLFAAWLAGTWLLRIGTGRSGGIRLRPAAAVAVASAAVAAFIVWNTTTEQRLQLAMRDVAGLQRPDGDGALLLSRLGRQLTAFDSPGSRADLLTRYAESDVAAAELQVSLAAWSPDGVAIQRVDLAPLEFDSAALAALVAEAMAGGEPLIRQVLGPTGRQVMLVAPHADGGATSVVASPRTRLLDPDPYATLLGFSAPDRGEPPYAVRLAGLAGGAAAQPGVMTWRRVGSEWHGDQVIETSQGPARAHVEVDIRSWPTRLLRASLIVMLDIALAGLLWALAAAAEGGFLRWSRARAKRWVLSYRGRLTLALFTFFVVPAVAFAAWSYQRLRGDDRGVRELLVHETLDALAAGEDSVLAVHVESETPIFRYQNAVLTSSSDPLHEMIAPAGRLLPRRVWLSLAGGAELTASLPQRIGGSWIFWGFRDASSPEEGNLILAAPARSDELMLDRRRRDITLLVLFATAVGGLAAFWLSGIAARVLARDLELSRVEVARAERVLAWGEMARQVAHEIKNPLTPIRLGVQHLRRARADRRADFDRVLEENVTRILAEIDRLDETARAFSRYGTLPSELPPAEAVDVAAILRDVVGLEKMGIGDVTWNLTGAGDPAFARARADELRDVLLNVFENARLARARRVDVSLERGGEWTLVEVMDDGAGIASDAIGRVFEPHFSTRTTGSGLGLAISRRLLESWGGRIDITSQEGRGARVVIRLQQVQA